MWVLCSIVITSLTILASVFLCNLSTPSLSPNIYQSFNPLSLLLYLENSDARVNTIAVQFDADI